MGAGADAVVSRWSPGMSTATATIATIPITTSDASARG